jgi:CMP-N-acetylneuraminic acid synthetase
MSTSVRSGTPAREQGTARIVALVPMRHHTERVPGKNYRPLGGRPLYHHIVQTLLACRHISKVVIDTDSEVIWNGVQEHFPAVSLIARPDHLKAGTTSMNEVVLHDVSQVEAEYYLQTHSTNPLLRSETITRAIEVFLQREHENDSLFSVTRLQARLWNTEARPINHDPAVLLRTQDLPAIYEENSCLYLFPRETIQKCRNRIGSKPLLFEINRIESWDIDEELDFVLAEFLYETYYSPRK